jgi:alpha-ketoglutarate-dependent taurine dioxygenase
MPTEPGKTLVRIPELGAEVIGWTAAGELPLLFVESIRGALPSFESFKTWAATHRTELDALILRHGGILLRAFPITSTTQFNDFASIFPPYKSGYAGGGAQRKVIEGQVMESTRYDQDMKIPLHSEMAYLAAYPARIAFFSKRTAAVGGETIIGSMRQFMRLLPPEIREKLERHSIHVVRNFAPAGSTQSVVENSDSIGWDDAFYTQSRAEVEQHCKRLGVEFTWNEGGGLTIVNVMKALTVHPQTHETFYRSHIHASRVGSREIDATSLARQHRPTGYTLDTGQTLSHDEAEQIQSVFRTIEQSFPWSDGDIMILDNLQVAHGRNPFSGNRELVVALLG